MVFGLSGSCKQLDIAKLIERVQFRTTTYRIVAGLMAEGS